MKTTRRRLVATAAVVLLAHASAAQAQDRAAALRSITVGELRDHVTYLASDRLAGRGAFEPGYRLAAEYAAERFRAAGLVPMVTGPRGRPSYLQEVRFGEAVPQNVPNAPTSPNVVGLLPGTGGVLADEYIVVSAHLDHLGVRNGEVLNGADDNASGSAAVLEVAQAAALRPGKRSVIFALFTGEEVGFLGSRHFLDNPPVPVHRIVLDINLDMVGRDSPEFPRMLLALGSADRTSDLLRLVRSANRSARANLDRRPAGEDPLRHLQRSDQLVFMERKIPAILITRGFTGPHYHQPSDDPGTIDYRKVMQAARLALAIAMEAADREVLFGPR